MAFIYAVENVDTDPAFFQRFMYGHPEPDDVVPGLSPSQVRVVSARSVHPRRERWNGIFDPNNCTRAATAQEIAAFDLDVRDNRVGVPEFLDLFTLAERIALRQQARGDCTSIPAVPPDETLADYLHHLDLRAAAGQGMQLRSPRVIAGLDLLVGKGILTLARKARILSGLEPV